MGDRVKLTSAQLSLLTQAVACGKATCVPEYRPRRKLVEYGLAIEKEGRLGSSWIEPTDAGRALLATNAKGE